MQNEQLLLEKKICSALIEIIEKSPLYYAMLKRIPKIFRHDLNKSCALGIDEKTGSFCILLNSKICLEASIEEIAVMFEHLLFHIFFSHQHKDRMAQGKAFHLASDLLINQNIAFLREYKNSHIRKKSIFGNILLASDLKYLPGFNLDEMDEKCVYEIWPQIEQQFGNLDTGTVTTIDEDNFVIQNYLSIPRFLKLNPGNQFKLNQQVRETIIGAAKELAKQGKSPGLLPEFLSKKVEAIFGDSGVDYSSIIKKFALRVKAKRKIKTWSRVNRRHPNQIKGKVVEVELKTKLLVVMDTSGSMWEGKNLDTVLGEIKKLSNVCNDIWIVGGDVIEQFRIRVDGSNLDFKNFNVTGGGGTDLQFGYEAAKDLTVDGIIAFTDGHIPPLDSFGIPSLFVIVPGGISVPQHENVFLL